MFEVVCRSTEAIAGIVGTRGGAPTQGAIAREPRDDRAPPRDGLVTVSAVACTRCSDGVGNGSPMAPWTERRNAGNTTGSRIFVDRNFAASDCEDADDGGVDLSLPSLESLDDASFESL